MHFFKTNILIHDVFYMFRSQGFLIRYTVLHAGMAYYVSGAEIRIKGFYGITNCKIFEFLNIPI